MHMSNYILVRIFCTDLNITMSLSTKNCHKDGHADICVKVAFVKVAKGLGNAFLQRKRVTWAQQEK